MRLNSRDAFGHFLHFHKVRAMMFPSMPDAHALAVLILIVITLYLFTREKIPLETSSLAVLVVLVAGFELFPLWCRRHRLACGGLFQRLWA